MHLLVLQGDNLSSSNLKTGLVVGASELNKINSQLTMFQPLLSYNKLL